jgi:hypothetical protein
MGKDSERTAANSRRSQNNGPCEAHDLGGRPQEDRSGAAGTVGAGKGCEEGGVRIRYENEVHYFGGGFSL